MRRLTCAFTIMLTFILIASHLHASVPSKAHTLSFNLKLINMNPAQEKKIESAVALLKEVIASETFKTRILNHSFKNQKTFVENRGLTNLEIYQKLLNGAEHLSPAENNGMDLEIELYSNAWTSTVGYTRPNTSRVWMNTKYFNAYPPKSVARNLIHEWLHKLGFTHTASYSKSRDYSVPYAIGYLVEELAGNL